MQLQCSPIWCLLIAVVYLAEFINKAKKNPATSPIEPPTHNLRMEKTITSKHIKHELNNQVEHQELFIRTKVHQKTIKGIQEYKSSHYYSETTQNIPKWTQQSPKKTSTAPLPIPTVSVTHIATILAWNATHFECYRKQYPLSPKPIPLSPKHTLPN